MAFQGDGNPEITPIEPQGSPKVGIRGRGGSPMALAHAGRDGLGGWGAGRCVDRRWNEIPVGRLPRSPRNPHVSWCLRVHIAYIFRDRAHRRAVRGCYLWCFWKWETD